MTYTYNSYYLDLTNKTIQKALETHNRLLTLCVDLRFPSDDVFHLNNGKVITRFFESLKAKINADIRRKENRWGRKLNCPLFYIWAREFGNVNNNKHYHVLILVNKDIYFTLGDFVREYGNLSAMIKQAWCSAITLPYEKYKSLVHFPNNAHLYLDKNKPDFESQYLHLTERAKYLTKDYTKRYHDGERSFGTSR